VVYKPKLTSGYQVKVAYGLKLIWFQSISARIVTLA